MSRLLVLLLLLPATALAQSAFDGTWVIDMSAAQLPEKPVVYLLARGMFRCPDCNTSGEIAADGRDQNVAETGYRDTLSVRIVDDHTVEIITKKAGKTMFTETDTVSPDGTMLTQVVKDTTEAETVTVEMLHHRVEKGPVGSHALSGSWRIYKMSRSENGSRITYRCTADGFSAETPLGEKFDAKFDGKDYPVEDDPAHTMVSVRRLGRDTIEQTNKRAGKVISVLLFTVAPDGKSIHVVIQDKDSGTERSNDMRRLP